MWDGGTKDEGTAVTLLGLENASGTPPGPKGGQRRSNRSCEEIASKAAPASSPAIARSSHGYREVAARRRRDFVQYLRRGIGLFDGQDLQSKVRNS